MHTNTMVSTCQKAAFSDKQTNKQTRRKRVQQQPKQQQHTITAQIDRIVGDDNGDVKDGEDEDKLPNTQSTLLLKSAVLRSERGEKHKK